MRDFLHRVSALVMVESLLLAQVAWGDGALGERAVHKSDTSQISIQDNLAETGIEPDEHEDTGRAASEDSPQPLVSGLIDESGGVLEGNGVRRYYGDSKRVSPKGMSIFTAANGQPDGTSAESEPSSSVSGNISFHTVHSTQQAGFVDVNWDGLPDHVLKRTFNNNVRMKRNKMSRVGLLGNIHNALRGRIELAYEASSLSVLDPRFRWNLKSVTPHAQLARDGGVLDGNVLSYSTRYEYADGYYDRTERAFLGYDDHGSLYAKKANKVSTDSNDDELDRPIKTIYPSENWGSAYSTYRYEIDGGHSLKLITNPLGRIAETHWYAYVSNNPVNYVDPTGMREAIVLSTGPRVTGYWLGGMFEKAAILAKIANFSNKEIPGYRNVTEDYSNIISKYNKSGLDVRIFQSEEDGSFVVAFEELNPFSSLKDLSTARKQALKGSTEGQFDGALKLVNELKEEDIVASKLTLTGSSLGGALSAYVASWMDIEAVIFNAAGLHPDNVGPYTDRIINYSMRGDSLTNLQKFTPLPNAIGKQRTVTPTLGDTLIAGAIGLLGGLAIGLVGCLAGGFLGGLIGFRFAKGAYLHSIGPMHRALREER